MSEKLKVTMQSVVDDLVTEVFAACEKALHNLPGLIKDGDIETLFDGVDFSTVKGSVKALAELAEDVSKDLRVDPKAIKIGHEMMNVIEVVGESYARDPGFVREIVAILANELPTPTEAECRALADKDYSVEAAMAAMTV